MVPPWALLSRAVLVVAVVVSVGVAWRLDDRDRGEAFRRRFVFGVPWGTLLTVGFVLFVYLVVQGGLTDWAHPVEIPFHAWSYFYPLGMVVAPFAHVSPDHLLGNLVGTLALAPVAEYAWGHSSVERDARVTNPVSRILAVPAAAIVAGLVSSAFAIGPIIGFSGVVFAFAGFALVRYPVGTVVAFAASGVVRQLYTALAVPVVEAGASSSFGTPWWANIAIQAHAVGLLLGVLVGLAVFRRRGTTPSAARLWFGTLAFAVEQSLWAVYWFRGNDSFVLFRALGTVLVLGLAVVVAASVSAVGRFDDALPVIGGVERRTAAAAVVVVAVAVLAVPAIPVDLVTTAGPAHAAITTDTPAAGPHEDLHVRDYTVRYAENVTDRQVAVVDLSAFGETTEVNSSGVIVASQRRSLWTPAVSKSNLEYSGHATVRVGGVGWSRTIHVSRVGWKAIGGGHAYTIRFDPFSDHKRLAYLSTPATADAVVAGRNVSVAPRRHGFSVVVSRGNETLGRAPLPANGTSTRVADLTFTRNGTDLFAETGGTRVRVAKKEHYH